MICPKHGVEMVIVREPPKVLITAPLHRCPVCTEEFRLAFDKVRSGPVQFRRNRKTLQRMLPPVIMSERWP